MAHTGSEMSDPLVSLLGPAEVRLGDEHMTHGEHTQTPQLLRGIEHNRGESTGHLGVETNLNTGLDL